MSIDLDNEAIDRFRLFLLGIGKIDGINRRYIKNKYYRLNKEEARDWIKKKLEYKMISEEEYLKELLMVSNSKGSIVFTMDGKIINLIDLWSGL